VKFFGGLNLAGDESFSGFIGNYSGTKGGGTHYTVGFLGAADFDADAGYVFGGAVGYGFDNGFSVELEAAYRRNKLDIKGVGILAYLYTLPGGTTGTKSGPSASLDGTDGHLEATSLMANAWYEFDTGTEVRPFVGGGVGIAWVDVHDIVEIGFATKLGTSFYSVGVHGDDSGFAWQLGGGLNWEVSPGKDLTVEYRYFNGPEVKNIRVHDVNNNLDYDYEAHSFMVGFRVGY